MYIHYSTGNNSGPRTLVRIVEVSVIGGVHFRRFHCISCFYFHGLSKPRKYFYNENFQIYGITNLSLLVTAPTCGTLLGAS